MDDFRILDNEALDKSISKRRVSLPQAASLWQKKQKAREDYAKHYEYTLTGEKSQMAKEKEKREKG